MSPLRTMILVLLLLSSGMALPLPSSVTECLARHPEVMLNKLQKPPYLRCSSSEPMRLLATSGKLRF